MVSMWKITLLSLSLIVSISYGFNSNLLKKNTNILIHINNWYDYNNNTTTM